MFFRSRSPEKSGDSSTVEQRTLTPLLLVRIQVPQPGSRVSGVLFPNVSPGRSLQKWRSLRPALGEPFWTQNRGGPAQTPMVRRAAHTRMLQRVSGIIQDLERSNGRRKYLYVPGSRTDDARGVAAASSDAAANAALPRPLGPRNYLQASGAGVWRPLHGRGPEAGASRHGRRAAARPNPRSRSR